MVGFCRNQKVTAIFFGLIFWVPFWGMAGALLACRTEERLGVEVSADASPMEAQFAGVEAGQTGTGVHTARVGTVEGSPEDVQADFSSVTLLMQKKFPDWSRLSGGQRVAALARYFAEQGDRPYVAGLLGSGPQEKPVFLSLRRFDCVLFVETVVALAQTLGEAPGAFQAFKQAVTRIRYRKGEWGYLSRLHYTSEWLAHAEYFGILKSMPGPDKDERPVDLLSRVLTKQNRTDAAQMQVIERSMVPKVRQYFSCASLQKKLKSEPLFFREGDVVMFTSVTPGLDVNHLGILAKRQDGQWGFWNAHGPGGVKKVILENESLESYCPKYRNSGVMLARAAF